MASNGKPQFVRNVFSLQSNGAATEADDAAVRQDKTAPPRGTPASLQPEPREKSARARGMDNKTPQTKTHGSSKRKTVQLVLWVKPIVKVELKRVAAHEGLSLSSTAGALLERALANSINTDYNALLTPVIEQAIHKEIQRYSNRIALLLARSVFASEQTRSLTTNILGRQPGVNEELLKQILAMTQRAAKGNITRKSPQMKELMEPVEKWPRGESAEYETRN